MEEDNDKVLPHMPDIDKTVSPTFNNNNDNRSTCDDSGIANDSSDIIVESSLLGSPAQKNLKSNEVTDIESQSRKNTLTARSDATQSSEAVKSISGEQCMQDDVTSSFDDDKPNAETSAGQSRKNEVVSELPTVFVGNQINVKKKTVLVSRVDGINVETGVEVSVYKCHMCGKMFKRLGELQCHLSLHSERHLTFYRCQLCSANFTFKTHLLRHLRSRHRLNLPSHIESSMTIGNGMRCTSDGEVDSLSNSLQSAEAALDCLKATSKESIESNSASYRRTSIAKSTGRSEDLRTWEYINGNAIDRGRTSDSVVSTSYICQICGCGFDTGTGLDQHVLRFHADIVTSQQQVLKSIFGRRANSNSYQKSQKLHRAESTSDSAIAGSHTKNGSGLQSRSNPVQINTAAAIFASQSSLSISKASLSENGIENQETGLDLAKHIREKEQLDDDVTVIIPSDPPMDQNCDVEENPQNGIPWTEPAEDEVSASGGRRNEIANAPMKSIMSTPRFRAKHRLASTPTISVGSLEKFENKPAAINNSLSVDSLPMHSSMALSIPQSSTGEICREVALPFMASSDISPLLRGLLPLPLISFFLNQAALTSSALLGTAMSNISFPFQPVVVSNHPSSVNKNSSVTTQAIKTDGVDGASVTSRYSAVPSSDVSPGASGSSAMTYVHREVKKEPMNWMSAVEKRLKGFNSKSSSLSRTQSRLVNFSPSAL